MIKYLLLVFVSLSLVLYFGAFSFREKQIKKEQVPEKIKTYLVHKYKNAKKIKCYIESDEDSTWYEVELIHSKEKISIIFLEDGALYELKKH